MNIRLQQLNPTVGDISKNTTKIIDALRKAENDGIDLLILPEMVVTAYPPMDLLEREAFLERVFEATEQIIKQTGDTAIIFGAPTPNHADRGRNIFNSAIFAHGGTKQAVVHKTLLPTYDVFDEFRYFEPNTNFQPIEFKGVKFGITVCEDIWYNENETQYHKYKVHPAKELCNNGADAIINISASPFTKSKMESRLRMLKQNAQMLQVPIFYANQAGANTEIIFGGDSMALDANGSIVARADLFTEDYTDVRYESDAMTAISEVKNRKIPSKEERMFRAVVTGLRDYHQKTQLSDKVILGLSGGIDSALSAVVAVEALGADSVIGITMPSQYSSEGSVSDSQKLADNLGIELWELPIKDIYDTYLDTLKPVFKDSPFGVAEENLQSRARGMILMAISNKFGYMLVTTGNKSEMAVGYNTLYGDLAGGLAVISDIYKTEVYAISRWLNEHYYGREVIPENTIEKPPSAELKPDQKDEDSLPSYDVLDTILELYIEEQKNVGEIADAGSGLKPALVRNVINMVDRSEYKRFQAPPGLKVSEKAFGSGRRLPIVQQWTGQGMGEKGSVAEKA